MGVCGREGPGSGSLVSMENNDNLFVLEHKKTTIDLISSCSSNCRNLDLSKEFWGGAGAMGDLCAGLHEVMGDGWGHDRVLLVVGVIVHELAHPGGGRHHLARSALGDQVQVAANRAAGLRVDLHRVQVGPNQGNKPGKFARLSVEDGVKTHGNAGVRVFSSRERF